MNALSRRLRTLVVWLALVLTARASAAEVVWRLSNPAAIGERVTTIVGAPQAVRGPKGGAIAFDGKGDGLFIADVPLQAAKVFTIEILFRPDEGGLAEQRFFHLQDSAGARAMIETRLDGRGHWWLDTFLTSGAPRAGVALIDASRVHPTGVWTWAALRFDGQRVAHFVNARKELERPVNFTAFGAGQLSIGVRQNRVYWFKGAIAEIRFHDDALPVERMQRVDAVGP